MKMDASTQTEVGRKNFAQQTDGGEGEWVNEDKEVEIVREIKGRKDEEDVAIIAVFCPIASNKKRTRDVKTQTASSTKEKGMQTEWMLQVIEIEESRRSNRDLLLRFIRRQWNLIEVREAFKVPEILSPIREFEEEGEVWKTWKAGEFVWSEDKENTQNNNNNNIDNNKNKRKRFDDNVETQTKKIKKETNKENTENSNINDNNDSNGRKRKSTDNKEKEQVTKKIKKEMRIRQEDLETLKGENRLNDEVINNYLELISNEDVYVMNSFFFPRLHINGHVAVKRWTKRINIFKFRKVIVPIHLGNHWCLAVIDMLFGEICYYDSFKGSQPAYLATLLEYLVQEAKEKNEVPINKEEWTLGNKTNIPCQTNGYDCGVFTCQFARYEAANRAIDFTQQDMLQIRARMARELQAGCLEE
ncbi:ubiquitin-like-specific protease ESD4 [Venturia canescens]|uniref:ubiquitin-like-specific protease ESD4 n=1 Tax=Venturia canescens TaxID=32260 RepID=UPI001C9CDF01|nr:ubiquitin-like-specific protease ESD4 [Venturia canescens]